MNSRTCNADFDVSRVVSDIRTVAGANAKIVFVWGNFNVVHPGHLRLLNFAEECGDFLVVGLAEDGAAGVHVPESLRTEGIRAISVVDYSFVLRCPPADFISALKPDIVVKGKEHEQLLNPEQLAVDAYGGRLLFSSGDARFSSLDLLQKELREPHFSSIRKPLDFADRHRLSFDRLGGLVQKFPQLKVVVIGDLIIDEYITCDPLGMSQEDPTIVVTPIKNDLFVGGAGIVAAHARGLGASVDYFGVVGPDGTAAFAQETLESYGVNAHLRVDDSRPTTLKQRFRARGKTLLRVSRLRQHDISQEMIDDVLSAVIPVMDGADLLIFSDFNYGCLPQRLVEDLIACCQQRGVMMVADSQASSQLGDVSRFRGVNLVTPTEHEARLSVREPGAGLVVLADALRRKAEVSSVIVTLGAEGVLIHAPDAPSCGLVTDQLPAFNNMPIDVSGAGDSLMMCAAMALAVGASIWEAAYLGSIAAACQVGRMGNVPLSANDLLQELAL